MHAFVKKGGKETHVIFVYLIGIAQIKGKMPVCFQMSATALLVRMIQWDFAFMKI